MRIHPLILGLLPTGAHLANALPASTKIPPMRTYQIQQIPFDLYNSPDPFFAGAPIELSNPPEPGSSNLPGPGRYAMTYTPFTSEARCKDAEAVRADISRIAKAGFSAVRLLSTDCRSLSTIGPAVVEDKLSLIIGIHISEGGIAQSSIDEQLSHILTFAASSDSSLAAIDLVTVGNEAIFNSFATATELAAQLSQVRAALRKAGYAGPVTTAEPLATVVEHASTLCPAMDVAAANLLPFFNADVSAPRAGELVARQVAELEALCPVDADTAADAGVGADDGAAPFRVWEFKPALAMDVGWPSHGRPNGDAVPGRGEQRVAMAAMADAIGSRAVFTSFEDDAWKDAGELGVETHWGAIAVFE